MTSDQIIERLGGTTAVALLCECTPQAVSQWMGINPKTNLPREIPNPRLMYLKAVRPEVFKEHGRRTSLAQQGA